ncbi:hypothetical protein Sviol_44550 [Streptomyces violascens]|uniref:Uncharacterized protein n=1 Tax=Streptomyces violascens TaxID=67381 RepID=A0ABQ3QRY8_9ACTN|nr:hypothetical protein Sviol_44550 [Streptomyces violascens]
MRRTVAEVHQGRQQAVNEAQFVFRPCLNCSAAGPRLQYGLMPLVPQRADLSDVADPRQAGATPSSYRDDRLARRR